MKNVPDYIRMLLYEHDYVTVPNLGAFIANYLPSSTNEISGSLMPPQKRIAFNEVLKQDDGLLATCISRREGVTLDESKRRIQSFVTDVKDSLAVKRGFNFDRIGNFSINQDRGLVFEPDRKNNFYSESFGFDSLFPRKENIVSGRESYDYGQKVFLDDTYENYVEKAKEGKSKKGVLTYALYALPIMILLSGLFYILFSNAPTKKSSLSSVIPLDYFSNSETKLEKKEPIKLTPQPLKVDKSEILKPDFETKTVAKELEKPSEKVVESKPVSEIPTPKVEEKNITEKKVSEKEKTLISTTNSTISTIKKRYVVVCGMFKNKENVEKLSALLQKNGFSPKIIPSNNLLKVIAAEADDMEEAKKVSEKLRSLTGDKGVIQKQ